MSKKLEQTIQCIDDLEREAAKIRRDCGVRQSDLGKVDGIRYAIRKLKLALRADGAVDSVKALTNGPAKPRGPRSKPEAATAKRVIRKAS